MRKLFRMLAGTLASIVLIYAVVGICAYCLDSAANTRINDVMRQAVALKPVLTPEATPAATAPPADEPIPSESAEPGAQPSASSAPEDRASPSAQPSVTPGAASASPAPSPSASPRPAAPIEVDFPSLYETCPEVVGWLYCPDTPINLPLVQSGDNEYYLRRLPDGQTNRAGSLFVDYRCAPDFSDGNTIVFGHNMKDDTMFGTLSDYRQQEYYDAHPIMWLLTPKGDYRVDLAAGMVTDAHADIYYPGQSGKYLMNLVRRAVRKSTFEADVTLTPEDRYLILSTCSYEFDDARYVLIGRLTPLE